MRLRTLGASVGVPAVLALALLPSAAHATVPSATTIGTLRVDGLSTFLAAATDATGTREVTAGAPAADTVSFPAPGTSGPLTIGALCFDIANRPGLPTALVHDAAAGDCLTFTTIAGLAGAYRFVADDPRSPVHDMQLAATADAPTLRFTESGAQFDLVTAGELGAPVLASSTVAPGDPLSGTASAGSHVLVLSADGTDVLCETDADEHGAWSCSPTPALEVGEFDLQLGQVSIAHQLSPLGPVHLTVTAPTAPAAPVLTSPTELTAGADQVLAGTAAGADTVRVTDADGATVCESPVADGRWSCHVDLSVGEHRVQLVAIGADGLASSPTEAVLTVVAATPGGGNGGGSGDDTDHGEGAADEADTATTAPPAPATPDAPATAPHHDRRGSLAYTGSDVVAPVSAAGLLVAVGVALTVIRRRA